MASCICVLVIEKYKFKSFMSFFGVGEVKDQRRCINLPLSFTTAIMSLIGLLRTGRQRRLVRGCLGYFSIFVIKHEDQDNLQKKIFNFKDEVSESQNLWSSWQGAKQQTGKMALEQQRKAHILVCVCEREKDFCELSIYTGFFRTVSTDVKTHYVCS